MQLVLTETPPSVQDAGMSLTTQAFSIAHFLGAKSDSNIFKLNQHIGSGPDVSISAFPKSSGYVELASNYASKLTAVSQNSFHQRLLMDIAANLTSK